jgi:hypothetical protein
MFDETRDTTHRPSENRTIEKPYLVAGVDIRRERERKSVNFKVLFLLLFLVVAQEQ